MNFSSFRSDPSFFWKVGSRSCFLRSDPGFFSRVGTGSGYCSRIRQPPCFSATHSVLILFISAYSFSCPLHQLHYENMLINCTPCTVYTMAVRWLNRIRCTPVKWDISHFDLFKAFVYIWTWSPHWTYSVSRRIEQESRQWYCLLREELILIFIWLPT